MESTATTLTGGVPGSTMVEGVFSLSKGGGGTGMAGDGVEDCNGELGTVTLLKWKRQSTSNIS